jgi:hypothetical protein
MNSIIINLLAEEQQAEQDRARDPFKVSLAVGIGALALVTAVSVLLPVFAASYKIQAAKLRREWQDLEAQQTGGEGGSLRVIKELADDLLELNRSRRLCAPQLALIKDLVPNSIQLTHLGFVTTIETEESGGSPADESAEGKAKRAAHPKTVERAVLRLEGIAVSSRPQPELEATAFQQILETNVAFQAYIKKVELRSVSRGATPPDGGGAGPYVAQFVIECQYKERQ